MSAVRGILSDLVERRLWPIAVVLVAAAVAIPVLLVKPASHAPAPADVAQTPAPAPAVGTPAVSLADAGGGPVTGNLKNPFRQQHVPKATAAASGPTTGLGPAKPGGGSAAGSGGTGAPSAGGGGGGTSSGPARPRSSAPRSTLQVRFGLAEGQRAKHDISPGSPLPSPTNPLLVYLGQTKAGKAAFLVSSDAQPQGDGECKPNKSICSTLYMKEGGTEFFDVTGPTGTVQYELDVLHVNG